MNIKCLHCGEESKIDEFEPKPRVSQVSGDAKTQEDIIIYVKEHDIGETVGDRYKCPKCGRCLAISVGRYTHNIYVTKDRCNEEPL